MLPRPVLASREQERVLLTKGRISASADAERGKSLIKKLKCR